MESGTLKILVADDHSVVRTGIIKTLYVYFQNIVVGEASTASEIKQHLKNERWNVVILDISIPGRNGIEILKDIKVEYPDTAVIIFSMYPEDQFAVRSLKAGASGYLSKDASSDQIAEAIRTVSSGGRYLTPSVMELITDELRNEPKNPSHQVLSDREYQVFLMIASGMNVSGVAEELSLSVKTISVYRANILKKMNLKNNSEIMHYAFKNALVS